MSSDSRTRLRRAIEAYARGHPNASDTVAGILGWWIPHDLVTTPAEVEQALDELVEAGVLRAVRLPDGVLLYSVRPGMTEQE